jgi:TPR repeat protein
MAASGNLANYTPEQGFAMVQQARDLGNKRAEFIVGTFYHYGLGTTPDPAKAMAAYQKTAAIFPDSWLEMALLTAGKPESAGYFQKFLVSLTDTSTQPLSPENDRAGLSLRVAREYRDGKIIPADAQEAEKWFRKAIKMGNAKAATELADLWIAQNHSPATDSLALWQQAAEQGETEAQLRLGQTYQRGTIVAIDILKAEQWYNKAAQAENPRGMVALASVWQQQGHQPTSETMDLLQRAAKLGESTAFLELGYAYEIGKLIPRDIVKAEQYFQQAISANPEHRYAIARFYETLYAANPANPQLPANSETAHYATQMLTLYQELAANKDARGLLKIARFYRKGIVLPVDYVQSRVFYEQAITAGSPKAAIELAKLEDKIQRDLLKAEKHRLQALRKSKQGASKTEKTFAQWQAEAKKGLPEALREVGVHYMQGNGVARNPEQGVEWVSKAADKGDTPAMIALARAYTVGVGVNSDLAVAYHWYQKAAEAGNAEGQYQLGLGYARGTGVEKDLEKAKQWLTLARNNGYTLADGILQSITEGK